MIKAIAIITILTVSNGEERVVNVPLGYYDMCHEATQEAVKILQSTFGKEFKVNGDCKRNS